MEQKVDFFSLQRRQLQTLCKQHKIPANTTNVAMATALHNLLNENGGALVNLTQLLTPSKPVAAESSPMPTSGRVTRSQAKKQLESGKKFETGEKKMLFAEENTCKIPPSSRLSVSKDMSEQLHSEISEEHSIVSSRRQLRSTRARRFTIEEVEVEQPAKVFDSSSGAGFKEKEMAEESCVEQESGSSIEVIGKAAGVVEEEVNQGSEPEKEQVQEEAGVEKDSVEEPEKEPLQKEADPVELEKFSADEPEKEQLQEEVGGEELEKIPVCEPEKEQAQEEAASKELEKVLVDEPEKEQVQEEAASEEEVEKNLVDVEASVAEGQDSEIFEQLADSKISGWEDETKEVLEPVKDDEEEAEDEVFSAESLEDGEVSENKPQAVLEESDSGDDEETGSEEDEEEDSGDEEEESEEEEVDAVVGEGLIDYCVVNASESEEEESAAGVDEEMLAVDEADISNDEGEYSEGDSTQSEKSEGDDEVDEDEQHATEEEEAAAEESEGEDEESEEEDVAVLKLNKGKLEGGEEEKGAADEGSDCSEGDVEHEEGSDYSEGGEEDEYESDYSEEDEESEEENVVVPGICDGKLPEAKMENAEEKVDTVACEECSEVEEQVQEVSKEEEMEAVLKNSEDAAVVGGSVFATQEQGIFNEEGGEDGKVCEEAGSKAGTSLFAGLESLGKELKVVLEVLGGRTDEEEENVNPLDEEDDEIQESAASQDPAFALEVEQLGLGIQQLQLDNIASVNGQVDVVQAPVMEQEESAEVEVEAPVQDAPSDDKAAAEVDQVEVQLEAPVIEEEAGLNEEMKADECSTKTGVGAQKKREKRGTVVDKENKIPFGFEKLSLKKLRQVYKSKLLKQKGNAAATRLDRSAKSSLILSPNVRKNNCAH